VRHIKRRPNSRYLGQRYVSAGLSGLVGETRVTSVGAHDENGNIATEEYVRRLTCEIVAKISRDIVYRHYVTLYTNAERPREM